MSSRKTLIAGNWKMHNTLLEGCKLAGEVAKAVPEKDDREVLIAPPITILSEICHLLHGSGVLVAAQNVCWGEQGAFTGEVSPAMILDLGASAAIVGHSERRQIFHETDEMINRRLLGGLQEELMMIFCIGETLAEREEGRTFAVLDRQLEAGLADVDAKLIERLVIAYEPVWAIGTGKTATGEQAQEVHRHIRSQIEQRYEKNVAEQIRILYGGSVKPSNVDQLMAMPDIDGALVGGAALDAESFSRIINFE